MNQNMILAMKYIKYLAIALIAMSVAACSDDEPKNDFTREFSMVYPQLPAGHKMISKIERTQESGGSSVAVVDYDGNNHVVKITATYRDKTGSETNKETIHIDYNNGAIICEKKIQPVTYSFEVNSQGAITHMNNVSTNRTAAHLAYDYNNQIESAQEVNPSYTTLTTWDWSDGKLNHWKLADITQTDSVAYDYTSSVPNKAGIDIYSNNALSFTTLVCEVLRNAGLFGATSNLLPGAVLKDGLEDPDTHQIELKRYPVTYTVDADGYVTAYTVATSPKLTVKISYR